MALLVSDILAATSNDVRILLSNSTDSAVMIDWVNRINKDVMHNGVYNNLLQAVASGTYTAASTTLTVTLTNSRRVLAVFDKVWNRPLIPLERSLAPMPTAEQSGPQTGPSGFDRYEKQRRPNQIVNVELRTTDNTTYALTGLPYPWPEYYSAPGSSGVYIFPAPISSTSGADVLYEKNTTNLTATSSTLDVPDDGKNVVVAGVNMVAFAYLKRMDDAAFWQKEYLRQLQESSDV